MAKKPLEYKDEKGNVLYGFSQSNLDRTNSKLNDIASAMRMLIVLFIILLIGMAAMVMWLSYNNVITRMIYGG